jgi:hypothetical protein
MERPTLERGDIGSQVMVVQRYLEVEDDGIFGADTERVVLEFQTSQDLDVDGIVGPGTWTALEQTYILPVYPPLCPERLDLETVNEICSIASSSEIANYKWKDRGIAPSGYINGMALAYATAYIRWINEDDLVDQMAKANTENDDLDALSWYDSEFLHRGMSNFNDGPDTLRHLFVLLMGLGMRESSGKHCEGRDMSADNVSADTAEAGLFQTSWNIRNCCTDLQVLFDSYSEGPEHAGYRDVFSVNVQCSESSWDCYGSGDGYDYQRMAKLMPLFACETTAIGLRCLRQHWGPINRKEVEIRNEADFMLQQVQGVIVGVA